MQRSKPTGSCSTCVTGDRVSIPRQCLTGRQGIAQSIRARMARFGGTTVIRSTPGEGAEVQLCVPRKERVK